MTEQPAGRSVNPMTRTVAVIGLAMGAVLLLVGLILGLSSVNRDGTDCGSALSPNRDAGFSADLTRAGIADATHTALGDLSKVEDDCSSATSDRKTLTWVLLGPGIALLIVGALAGMVTYGSRRPDSPWAV